MEPCYSVFGKQMEKKILFRDSELISRLITG